MITFILQWLLLNIIVMLFAQILVKYCRYMYLFEQSIFTYQNKLEALLFKFTGLNSAAMDWLTYLKSLLKFELIAFITLYIHARQGVYFKPAEAFQFAASFVTNTNWQSVPGEVAWSKTLWILGVIFNNFQSPAIGICVLVVFCRAFMRKSSDGLLGNFWIDLWRTFAYLLIPLALVFSILLVSQGVQQNLHNNIEITQYSSAIKQTVPRGPFAAHVSIKLLGTNGGSFTLANGSSPIENPTAFSHFLGLFMMLLLPSFGCFLFGNLIRNKRLGYALWGTMFVLASIFIVSARYFEASQMLGKEVLLGTDGLVLWNGIMTATATGANAGILELMQPLSVGSYLFLINLGEIAFGGVGMGLVNLIMVFIVSAFIMNLLTGCAASFLGKTIPLNAIKLTMFYIIFCPCLILIGVIFLISDTAPYSIASCWYAISSWVQNNGSSFYFNNFSSVTVNYCSGILMLLGRFVPIMMVLALAGILAKAKFVEAKQEAFLVDSLLFCLVSMAVILIVTLLAFLPLWSFSALAGQFLLHGL